MGPVNLGTFVLRCFVTGKNNYMDIKYPVYPSD